MKAHLLMIQPNGLFQTVERFLWASQKVQVDIAINGDRAIEMANRQLYDVIVVDSELEDGFDGFEVIQAIRNFTLNQHAPFLMVTSNETLNHLMKAIELNVSWYCVRPLTKGIARAAIHSINDKDKKAPCLIVHNRHLIES